MKAVGIRAYGGRDRLEILEVPRPEPAPGEVGIAIHAAGVNPIDWKIREGLRRDRMPHVLPIVLGWDAAGVVESLGEGTTGFSVGDRVFAYARKEVVHDGTYAEAIALPSGSVAHAPTTLDAVHAAAVPLASLTAHQALATLDLSEGETLLVHAAAGGVGAFAVQLARVLGARVLGTAREPRHPWLRELGCDAAIDYTRGDLEAAVLDRAPGGVDAVLDAVGGDALTASPALLRDGGRLVSLVEQPQAPAFSARGIRAQWIFAAPDGVQLGEVAALIDEGRVAVHVERTYALEDAVRAHERLERRHVRGKLVLRIRG